MKIENIGKRNYLVINNKKVKMIPEKYLLLEALEISNVLNDLSKVRLNDKERFALEYRLLLRDVKENEPLVYDYIKDRVPKSAHVVSVKFGEDRTELHYEDGLRIRCGALLYKYCSLKENIKSLT